MLEFIWIIFISGFQSENSKFSFQQITEYTLTVLLSEKSKRDLGSD